MKRVSLIVASLFLVLFAAAGTASAQGIGVGVKGGVVFPDFSSDDFDIDNRTGWQFGLFFGGNRTGIVGVQAEINYLRKSAESTAVSGYEADLDYLQIPVLLKLHTPASSASKFQFYGIVGPSFDIKLRETLAGGSLVVSDLDDAFNTFDIGVIFGAGIEAGRVIFEGRYSRGFRQINDKFQETAELKSHSFAVLVGVRFN